MYETTPQNKDKYYSTRNNKGIAMESIQSSTAKCPHGKNVSRVLAKQIQFEKG